MARLILILIFSICASWTKAQNDSVLQLTQKNLLKGSYTNFYIDNLGSVYLINSGNQIKKINDRGDSIAVSNASNRLGDIFSLDVSNPLKTVVYYKDFTTIAVLDRLLKNINTIDLRKYGIFQAQAVAISYDNNYWVFDEVENKLEKIDDKGNTLLSTPDLRTVFDSVFIPEKIIDYSGYVYLYNKTGGIKIFDYYGALKQSIAPLNWDNIQVIKNSILGFDSTAMYKYTFDIFTETRFPFHPYLTNVVKIQKMMNVLYALKDEGLYSYVITPN